MGINFIDLPVQTVTVNVIGSSGGSGSGSGTVTSVAFATSGPSIYTVSGSPISTSGSIIETLNTQSSAIVFAGPTVGAPAIPTFRALSTLDVPAINLARSGPGGVTGNLPTTNLNNGTNANSSTFWRGDGTWVQPAGSSGSGTVTSVAFATSGPSIYTVSGSPITGSGTIVLQENLQTSATIFAGPSVGNSSTAPTFRSIVSTDLPSISLSSTGGIAGGVSNNLSTASLNSATSATSGTFWNGTGTWSTITQSLNVSTISSNITPDLNMTYLIDSTSARSMKLPAPTPGFFFNLADLSGTMQNNNLILIQNSNESIEGVAASKIFQTNFGAWTIFSDGTNWFIW